MNHQKQLDQFVRDLFTSLEQYTSFGLKGSCITETDQYLLGKIEEQTGGASIELWSEDNQITLFYSQSHWHCPSHEPFRATDLRSVEDTCQEVKQDVMAILSGSLVTYSVWQGEQALGSGNEHGTVEDAIQSGTKRV